MFFVLTEFKIKKRNLLKETLSQLKKNNASFEEIKDELNLKGFNQFTITSLAPSHKELIDFLGITEEEFNKLWTIKWMS